MSKLFRTAVATLAIAGAGILSTAPAASAAPAASTRVPVVCDNYEKAHVNAFNNHQSEIAKAKTASSKMRKAKSNSARMAAMREYDAAKRRADGWAAAFTAAKKGGKLAGCNVPLLLRPFPKP